MNYQIIERCNLNCSHCNFFSSLVSKDIKPKSMEQITADLTLLSKYKEYIMDLSLVGGEAFLHPLLGDIIILARKLFPNNKVSITTNGTLVEKIRELKDVILDNNIVLNVTIYPFKEDVWENFWKIREIIPDAHSWVMPVEKGFSTKLLCNERQEFDENLIKSCFKRTYCNQLKNGKLWICHYAAYLNRLKEAFPNDVINIEQDDKCYIDLNNDELTGEDILEWQRSTMPEICYHCLDLKYGYYYGPTEKWKTTDKQLSEWVAETD